jgi:guanylate kinase
VEEFKKRIEAQEFAEWAVVHDNYYGTPKSFIDATINSGRTIIMDIDVYGKKKFDALYPDATGIFIQPPSLRELETRLRNRKTDPEEAIRKRLANAQKEMLFASQEGKYEYTIVNSDLEKAKQEVLRVVKQITGA